MYTPTFLDLSVVTFSLTVFLLLRKKMARNAPLPPGPPGLPLLGNLFDMRSDHKDWLSFFAWGQQYGDICSLTILGQTLVILNSVEVADAMLSTKSAIYSDRPVLQMGGELVGWKNTLVLLSYGDRWRRTRRFFHSVIGSSAVLRKFEPGKELETHKFLLRLLKKPDQVRDHCRSLAGALVLRDAYGYKVTDYDNDPFIHIADEATDQFSRSTAPPGYLVDFIPFLKHLPHWFPGTTFKKQAKDWGCTLNSMVDMPLAFVKNQLATGIAPLSFTSVLLDDKDSELTPEKEFETKWAAASLYSGAADTTVSAMSAFFLAMTIFPEALIRAQQEIDRVVGTNRLPNFSDRLDLPYIEALMWEVLRYYSVAPTGVPHRLNRDDIHEGYFIPKGTIVIANLWGMSHDERIYTDPMVFRPERFLGESPECDPRHICFGFGRRICPGLQFADSTLWIFCAMTCAVFSITKDMDESGHTATPILEQLSGTISHPGPFKCSIKPRSDKLAELVQLVEL